MSNKCPMPMMQAKLSLILIITLFIAFALPVRAQEVREQVVFAEPVTIIVDNVDPATARDNAMRQGALEALRMLVTSLPNAGEKVASRVSKREAEDLFYAVSVEQEQIGDNFYRGIFRYSFRQSALEAFLNSQGVNANVEAAPTEGTSKNVMLIPIWQEGTEMKLEPQHPWWQAWQHLSAEYPNENIVMPAGDMDDLQELIPTKLLGKQEAPLQYLKEKYNVQHIMVVMGKENITAREIKALHATQDKKEDTKTDEKPKEEEEEAKSEEEAKDETTLTPEEIAEQARSKYPVNMFVVDIHLSPANRAQEYRFTIQAHQLLDMTAAGQYSTHSAAAQTSFRELANRYNLFAAVESNDNTLQGVVVPISTLEDWRRTRLLLETATGVQRVEVKQLTKTEAIVDISYLGAQENLHEAIQAQGLQLQQFGGSWLLSATNDPAPEHQEPAE